MAIEELPFRDVRRVPDLLGYEVTFTSLRFNGRAQSCDFLPVGSGDFVVSALAGEQWPTSTLSGLVERSSVVVLAVTVVSVSMPSRSRSSFCLQFGIDNFHGVGDLR